MGKVLRVFLILLLLVAIGALVMEYFMYQKRTELDRREVGLRDGLMRVSQKINAPREPYIEAIATNADVAALGNLGTMGPQLGVIESNTVLRYEQLYLTKDELKKTHDELTQTQQELAQTKQELDAARQEITGLNEKLTQKEAEIARAQQKIGELETQITELTRQAEDQKKQIAQLEKEKTDMLEEKQRLEDAIAPFLPPPMPSRDKIAGLKGHVVLVDPEWNFVVLDIGKIHGVQKNTQMLVHRGEQLIGRIRISDVRDDLSVGDVERAWVTSPLQPGDRVFIQ